jgi:S-formylglutathione hydrolase FrmB
VQNITVPSPALGGYADPVMVVLPPGYASHPLQRYPVLYLLHGFPGLGLGFLDIGQAGTTEATLVAAGRMKPVIMVIPTGTEGGYGALNIGLHHPSEFGLIESWSGYTKADHIPAIFGHSNRLLNYNSPEEWVFSVAPQLRTNHTYIWFYIGAEDHLAAQNSTFAAELTSSA